MKEEREIELMAKIATLEGVLDFNAKRNSRLAVEKLEAVARAVNAENDCAVLRGQKIRLVEALEDLVEVVGTLR